MFLLILERDEGSERERGGKKGRKEGRGKRKINWLPLIHAPTGDQTHNFLAHRTILQPSEPPGQGCKVKLYHRNYGLGGSAKITINIFCR